MSGRHAYVPVGTLRDYEGEPVTVRRDYTALVLPDAMIPLDQLPALRQIIAAAEAGMIACAAELAALAELDGEAS